MKKTRSMDKGAMADKSHKPESSQTSDQTPPLIRIDLHGILRRRLKGWKGRLVPGFLISWLEKVIHQDGLNELLRVGYPARGHEFTRLILSHLQISVETIGLDNLPQGRYVFASNHPLGGLDGITLVDILGAKYGDHGIKVLVNDMLMNVDPLKNVFLPVNKYGAQGRQAARDIGEAFGSDLQVVTFPAGLVSRLGNEDRIADLTWQKAFAVKALESGRQIVPVYFEALNSMRFYRAARWRRKLGLKLNVEQILLPSEIFRSRGKQFRVIFGSPIDPAPMKASGQSPKEIAAVIREATDSLKPKADR
ncbi:MAG: glycerol acyltransferase [Muribaculum sp.]|nr:glycerol acyltransferase [Muribaculum sp.]